MKDNQVNKIKNNNPADTIHTIHPLIRMTRQFTMMMMLVVFRVHQREGMLVEIERADL